MDVELAIFDDCGKLLEKFITSGENSFKSFAEQWKEMNFLQIFSLQNNIEKRQTAATIFHFAKRAVCGRRSNGEHLTTEKIVLAEVKDLLWRAGAMYLMYSVYFEQPNEQPVYIEVSQNTWYEINQFLNSLTPSDGTDEVLYVFSMLLNKNAFQFTALDYCIGLENLVDYDKFQMSPSQLAASNLYHPLRNNSQEYASTQKSLCKLAVVETAYNEMKLSMIEEDSNVHKEALPQTKVSDELQNCFRKINELLQEKSEDDNTLTTQTQCNKSKKNTRASKQKEDKSCVKDTDFEQPETSEQAKQRNLRRMSARTVFLETLPRRVLTDLTESNDHEGVDIKEEIEDM